MADNPNLTIRVTDEAKELFNTLAADFENKNEFINRLLTVYTTEKVKESESKLKPSIEAVQTLTGRLIDVLAGVSAEITAKEEQHKDDLEKQRISFEETRSVLQLQINRLKQDLAENKENSAIILSETEAVNEKYAALRQHANNLEVSAMDRANLVEEYKNKIDSLTGLITKYEGYAEENEKLKDSVNALNRNIEELQRNIIELNKEQAIIKDRHRIELEHLQNTLAMQRETALLELERSFQKRLEEQQTKHADIIEAQQIRYIKIISEYEDKVRAFLSE